MPLTAKQESIQAHLEALPDAPAPAATEHLAAILSLWGSAYRHQLSGMMRLLRMRREAWRPEQVVLGALERAELPTDTPTLLHSLMVSAPVPSRLAGEVLGTRPECVPALLEVVGDDSGEWMDQQMRWCAVTRVAEALGPEEGGALLGAIWAVTKGAYRDVHYNIGACLQAWGDGAVPFLLARLADDPQRALGEVETQARRWGHRPEALLPALEALCADAEHGALAERALAKLARGG